MTELEEAERAYKESCREREEANFQFREVCVKYYASEEAHGVITEAYLKYCESKEAHREAKQALFEASQ